MQKSLEMIKEFVQTVRGFRGWHDPAQVETLIMDMGINGEKPHELPGELVAYMGGVRSWVMPNQTAPYLSWLDSQGPFSSYLEIGTRYGGTFMLTCEALRSRNLMLEAVGCDVICRPVELGLYMDDNGFPYHHGSSSSEDFGRIVSGRRWGVCLVDGSHRYEDVMRDYRMVEPHCDVIVLHDISSDACPGVVRAWGELKGGGHGSFNEFTSQYFSDRSYMGIGVIDKRGFAVGEKSSRVLV